MERAEALEAQLETLAAGHAKEMAAVNDRCSTLEGKLLQAQKAAEQMAAQSSAAESNAERIAAEFKDLEAATKEDREKAVEVAAENRVLIATLRSMQDECHVCKQLEKDVDGTDRELDQNMQRISLMSNHLRSLQLEIDSTESRLEAKHKEVKTEQDLQKLNHFEQKELKQWLKASSEKEEVNKALGISQHKENVKLKALAHDLERWSRAAVSEKAALEQELSQSKSAQAELDATADAFKKLQKERQETVAQWEQTLATVSRHDDAIKEAANTFAKDKTKLQETRLSLQEAKAALGNEEGQGKAVESQITALERELLHLRRTSKADEQKLESTLDEMEHLKNSLSASTDELAVQRAANEHARGVLASKNERVVALKARAGQAREELQDNTLQLSSIEDDLTKIETLLQMEDKGHVAATKLVASLKDDNMRRKQSLHDAASKERLLLSGIAGCKAQATNLRHKKRTLAEQGMRQREVLYQVDFCLVMLKRSLARAGGQRTDDEAAVLHARIAELAATLDGRNAEQSLFQAQIKKTEQDLGNARRKAAELSVQCKSLADAMLRLDMETECTSRCLRDTTKDKDSAVVDKDVLAVDVARCREALVAKVDEVLLVEHERAQLQESLEERRSAMAEEKDCLQAELKMMREDLHRIMLELTERRQRASKLQAKYETQCSKSIGAEGADESRSQAYYVIKAALDKQELLQQKQDILKAIGGREEDVAGLDNAVADMAGSNAELAQSFREKDANMAMYEARQKQLRKQLNRKCGDMRDGKLQEKALEITLEAAKLHCGNLSAEEDQMRATDIDVKKRKENAERSLAAQRQKQVRAVKRVETCRKELSRKKALKEGAGSSSMAELAHIDNEILKQQHWEQSTKKQTL
ncbi:hypothetical protein COCSUDRAFT_61461 [Coccomyxa subellipsoidea C-169]|uniref:Uncharacterized protein n=1 Tax=Coccomyxa subellipsoidea (strain C-169) TaxID=574566 RepID=I0Z3K4_COCSC|nr:hypothetical protein COCSUDRAFT_61461 [Coccomyxa subellipsoidea C-169]EIE25223.1 hypothetical protein COCSUDRAFT_61461 [Coccomyxa subellipsoidea C-169]|eukprot:XP_005649767.1 hypothetical protein COCSUDRAFT_61461 [Coccomyxa subellipsoidea C-169]